MAQTLPVFDIQKYSIHDGDGIRTTIFFKGCPIRCAWCHNPESQSFRPELLWNAEKCTGCGWCVKSCPQKAVSMINGRPFTNRTVCIGCGECAMTCLSAAREAVGQPYTVEELLKEAEKDQMFFERSGGGVTLSGGEVMAAEPFSLVVELARCLQEKGISVFVDTSGCVSFKRYEEILPYTDVFLYDVKMMNPQKHREFVGMDNPLIFENLQKLSEAGARIRLRLPLIEGINAEEEDVLPLIRWLRAGLKVEKIHLLPYHDIGKDKYRRLERPYDSERFQVPSAEKIEKLIALFHNFGIHKVEIGG